MTGKQIITVVGIDEYPSPNRLHNAVRDATGVARFFDDSLDYKTPIPPLLNGQATFDNINRLLDEQLPSLLSENDSLVLFFAGHGIVDDHHGYLLPVDGDPDQLARCIELTSFLERVDALPAKHILVILDACYAGAAFNVSLQFRFEQPDVKRDVVRKFNQDRYLTKLASRRSRKLIAAALSNERASDGGTIPGHSIFTSHLLSALEHGGEYSINNRYRTGSQLGQLLVDRVGTAGGSKQIPEFGRFGSDRGGELAFPIATNAQTARHFYAEFQKLAAENPTIGSALEAIQAAPYENRKAFLDTIKQLLQDSPDFDMQLREILPNQRIEVTLDGLAEEVTYNVQRALLWRGVAQVLTLVGSLALIALIIFGVVWWQSQPAKMTGDFNVAIAQFNYESFDDGFDAATKLTRDLNSAIDKALTDAGLGEADVTYNKMPLVVNNTEAEALAEQVNANLVIYGFVSKITDDIIDFTPHFYVSQQHLPDIQEVTGSTPLGGQHVLDLPVTFTEEELSNNHPSNLELQQRTVVLTELVKGLVYLEVGNNEKSREAFQNSLDAADLYPETFEGKELLYLMAAHTASIAEEPNYKVAEEHLQQAFDLNDNYGRGYIAQGNLHYYQNNYFAAIDAYETAAGLTDQPPRAFVNEKAAFNIGNVNLQTLQDVRRGGATIEEQWIYGTASLQAYEAVLAAYERANQAEGERLLSMVAQTHYYMAVVYHELCEVGDAAVSLDLAVQSLDELAAVQRRELPLLRRMWDRGVEPPPLANTIEQRRHDLNDERTTARCGDVR